MLVLSRRVGETVIINHGTPNEVRIQVVAFIHGGVRLGFEADPNIAIFREEILPSVPAGKESEHDSTIDL